MGLPGKISTPRNMWALDPGNILNPGKIFKPATAA